MIDSQDKPPQPPTPPPVPRPRPFETENVEKGGKPPREHK